MTLTGINKLFWSIFSLLVHVNVNKWKLKLTVYFISSNKTCFMVLVLVNSNSPAAHSYNVFGPLLFLGIKCNFYYLPSRIKYDTSNLPGYLTA